mmetsp:Transcript_16074/g.33373  ORF Transcript_16074/g.33373 Transcript_16074/m.33373 type:complete len:310 (+) Transcript_16074:617-1546(+)
MPGQSGGRPGRREGTEGPHPAKGRAQVLPQPGQRRQRRTHSDRLLRTQKPGLDMAGDGGQPGRRGTPPEVCHGRQLLPAQRDRLGFHGRLAGTLQRVSLDGRAVQQQERHQLFGAGHQQSIRAVPHGNRHAHRIGVHCLHPNPLDRHHPQRGILHAQAAGTPPLRQPNDRQHPHRNRQRHQAREPKAGKKLFCRLPGLRNRCRPHPHRSQRCLQRLFQRNTHRVRAAAKAQVPGPRQQRLLGPVALGTRTHRQPGKTPHDQQPHVREHTLLFWIAVQPEGLSHHPQRHRWLSADRAGPADQPRAPGHCH